MTRLHVLAIVSSAVLLGACAEREQAASDIRADQQPFAGTDRRAPFMTSGWKPGDRQAWEQHLKVRTQSGQNEYARIQ